MWSAAWAAIVRISHEFYDGALSFVRSWWRPVSGAGLAGSLIVNGIVLPLRNHTGVDLGGLAALFGSAAPLIVSRSWEKVRGVA